MKKYFAKGLGFLALGFLLVNAVTVIAATSPATNSASAITMTDAVLNGTADDAATGSSFWASTSTFSTASPVLPPGVFSTPNLGAVTGGTPYSASLSSTGITVNPGTTYYFTAWVEIGGTWYPGSVLSFTTLSNTQTIVFDSVSPKTYGDGTFVVSATGGASGNPVTFGASGSCTIAVATVTIVSAGDCTITANQVAGGGYLAATPTDLIIPIAKKSLTITSGVTVDTKEYDKTTPATLTFTSPVLDGVVVGDELDVSVDDSLADAEFDDSDAGIQSVTVTGVALTGAKASNYDLVQPSLTGVISPRAITVTAVSSTKVYDQTDDSFDLPSITSGTLVGSDTPDFFQDYDNKNVGTGKTLVPDGEVNDGNSGNNYAVTFTPTLNGVITKETLNVTPSALDKVYDALTSAVISFSDDRISGDVLTLNGTAQFLNKLVGMGKLVQVTSFSFSGTDSGNYTPNVSGSLLFANITTATLTPTLSASNKVYDGNNTASATCTVTPEAGDVVNCVVGTATFSDQNAANGKTVSATGITITGPDAANYVVIPTATTTADITPKSVTVGFTADNKEYDGNNSATILTRTVTAGIVGADVVNALGGTATFNNKNVATGKTVTATGFTLDNSNYAVGTINTTTANVTAKALSVTASGVDKMYDGTVSASVVYGDDRVSGDLFNPITGTATFADKHVGNNKTVSVTGISVTGTDAGNYTFNTTTSTTADIDVRPITVTAQSNTKVYNATTSAAALPVVSVNTIATGDSAVLSETYDNKNVGTGKTMTPAIVITDGNSGNNYAVTLVTSANGTITQAPATVSFTANNKVYDQNTSATILTRTVTGNIAPDAVITATGGTATFNNKNVGNGKAVTATGFTLSDSNYFVNSVTSTTANITPKSLAVTAAGVSRMYDGTTSATVTYSDDRISGDVFNVLGTATFATKHVGTSKTVSVSGISLSGTDAGNYTPNTTTSTTANITARPITVTAQSNTKVYDGFATAAATPVVSVNTIATGDTAGFSETYNNKTVATSKTLTPAGSVNDGNSGNNYSVTFVNNTSGVITAKALTVSATGINKVYDANANATVTLSDNRVSGDTLTTSYSSATFANKNVGTGKTVSVSGISVTGTDAGNYTFNTTATTTANITAKALTITASASNKVYDTNNVATVVLSHNAISGDDIVVTNTGATFSDKNVANGKTVSTTFTLTGADTGNYTATASPVLTTANITAKALTITAIAQDKTEDGTTLATVTLSNDALVGDVVTQTFTSANFSDALVGSGKTVTVLGIATAGVDAGNYSANTTATTTANINARASSGNRPNSGGGSSRNNNVNSSANGQVLGAEKFNFTALLKQGVTGAEVMELQKFLNANNFGPLVADGKFGPKTKAAVIKFQLANGLTGDGVVGPKTRAILNK